MKLFALTEEQQYRIDRTIKKVANGIFWVGAICILIGLYTKVKFFFFVFMAAIVIGFFCEICRAIFFSNVKSEEEEEKEQLIKEIVQETLQQQEKKSSQATLQTDYSPLRNLTAEQEQKVRDLLRNLPSHANKADAINMALNAQYLTALAQSDKADLQDKKCLRLWVEQLSEKTAPEQRQFNEAFDNVSMQKVAKARKDIERIIGSNLADNPSVGDSNTAN